jgi:hypothetical protein
MVVGVSASLQRYQAIKANSHVGRGRWKQQCQLSINLECRGGHRSPDAYGARVKPKQSKPRVMVSCMVAVMGEVQ